MMTMTTTMTMPNQTTASAAQGNATIQDYWNLTAQIVAPFVEDEPSACDEVASLTSKWDQHKFGLCCECDVGLDDEADFVVTGNANEDDTVLMCYGCWTGGSDPQLRI